MTTIDMSRLDSAGNVIAPVLEAVEGQEFSFTFSNPVGYIERSFEIQDISATVHSATIGAGSGTLQVFPGSRAELGPPEYNESIRPDVSFEFGYAGNELTLSGGIVENYNIGSFTADVFIAADIVYRYTAVIDGEERTETINSPGGFHGAFTIHSLDNDEWGTQALEDAKNVRFQEIQDQTDATQGLYDNLTDLFDQIEDAGAQVDAAALGASLSALSVAASLSGGVVAKGGAKGLGLTLQGMGVSFDFAGLAAARDVKSVGLLLGSATSVSWDAIAADTAVTPAQSKFIKGFGAIVSVFGVLDAVNSFATLNERADYSEQLKDQFGDIAEVREGALETLNETVRAFNEFMNYYNDGVAKREHNPASFSTQPVVTPAQTGSAANDNMFGASGNDTLSGEDGDDRLVGGGGDDDLTGGFGIDFLDGGPGDDRLSGDDGNDELFGGDGTDTINGGDGDDTILGGDTSADRRDTIFAGAGNDMIDAGYGNDLVYGQDGNDTIAGGFGADELFGQNGDDVITGSAFSDLVFGGAGDDFVNGGFGFDRINGGTGADRFFHSGADGHASDWVQDYISDEGDVLLFGGAGAAAADFVVRFAHTATPAGERSGDDDIEEAFVNFRGETLWALVDGGGQAQINIQIGGEVFDLLA